MQRERTINLGLRPGVQCANDNAAGGHSGTKGPNHEPVHAASESVEAPVHLCLHGFEAPVGLFETPVYLIKSFIYLFEAFIYLFEAFVELMG